MVDKDAINALLSEGVAEVQFVKKDGTNRIMLCTTKVTLIPERAFGNSKDWNYPDVPPESAKAKNPDIAVIWDLQKDAWRSFRYDSVTSAISHQMPEPY